MEYKQISGAILSRLPASTKNYRSKCDLYLLLKLGMKSEQHYTVITWLEEGLRLELLTTELAHFHAVVFHPELVTVILAIVYAVLVILAFEYKSCSKKQIVIQDCEDEVMACPDRLDLFTSRAC